MEFLLSSGRNSPFLERGTLLIKYSISGEARGRTETKTKLTCSLDRSRLREDASSDFSAHETRNIRQTSRRFATRIGLKAPADRAAKCWATGDQFNPSFKKRVAAEGKPSSLLMVIAFGMPERVFYIAPAPNVTKHEELNDL